MKSLFWKIFVCFICFTNLSQADLAKDARRHSLTIDHPFHEALDHIFASSKTLDSERDLVKAGFTIIQLRDPMFVIAKHPALPGHLVKVHLHSSSRSTESRWKNLVRRCNAAERLRKLIQKENLRYFTVPDKWIYTTPTRSQDPVLIVTRMNIVSEEKSKYAWKNYVQRDHLKELYCIIKHNCGSSKLEENVPYTKEGVFACVDTEKSPQGHRSVKRYLSKKMRDYWDELVRKDEKQS